jgi:hypothetical protein
MDGIGLFGNNERGGTLMLLIFDLEVVEDGLFVIRTLCNDADTDRTVPWRKIFDVDRS